MVEDTDVSVVVPVGGEYNKYTTDNTDVSAAKENISFDVNSAQLEGAVALNPDFKGENALVWDNEKGSATWTFDVPSDAYYNLKLSYASVKSGVDYSFSVLLDGQVPFEEAQTLEFPRIWENVEKEFKTDNIGNELSPEQKEIDGYYESVAKSATGVTVEPYAFYLTAGTHTITLTQDSQSVAINAVTLAAPEKVSSYKELSKGYDKKEIKNAETIVIEGENASLKTSSNLIPKSDNSDAGMSPIDVLSTKLNYIGGTSWQEAGQTLIWDFKVEKAGYYSLGIRYRQSDVINAESWRWLKIDGKTPFEEAKGIRFPYCASWEFFEYGDGEEPYYVWLDEGEHTRPSVLVGY